MKVKFDIKLNTPNLNGLTHTTEGMAKAVEKYQINIANYRAFGQLGIPENNILDLAEVSHKIKSLEIIDDELCGDVEILKTPKGEILQSLINELGLENLRFVPTGTGVVQNKTIINYTITSLDFIPK